MRLPSSFAKFPVCFAVSSVPQFYMSAVYTSTVHIFTSQPYGLHGSPSAQNLRYRTCSFSPFVCLSNNELQMGLSS